MLDDDSCKVALIDAFNEIYDGLGDDIPDDAETMDMRLGELDDDGQRKFAEVI